MKEKKKEKEKNIDATYAIVQGAMLSWGSTLLATVEQRYPRLRQQHAVCCTTCPPSNMWAICPYLLPGG
jgi:hypothetical protein